ncbi:MAG: NUDIX domain-containing protein [Actinobacteria bacterium]|nr:NUDIX domain-containing protein [Actinomycetota bacterium]
MSEIRLSLKAIIFLDGRLLASRCRDHDGDWYMLPGGGQMYGETIPESLMRECLEEAGCHVEVGSLRFVRDYIAKNHEFADSSGDFHQVELWFECKLLGDLVQPTVPDTMQTGVEWLDLNQLAGLRLYPKVLREVLVAPPKSGVIYLGDVN